MRKNPLRLAHAVPVFTDAFLSTMQQFKAAIIRTRSVAHEGTKGSMRESPLAAFFKERLPDVYGVTPGEVVDLENHSGPQLDVLFYDRTRNFPFVSEHSVVLPAEALLASIEVKSRLNSGEVLDCLAKSERLRRLRPFKKPLAGRDIGDPKKSKRQARYLHCVFAYDTDLVPGTWAKREFERFSKGASQPDGIDIVYVVGRGLIQLNEHKYVPEEESTAAAFTIFYFSILNFLDRESRRRGITPYSSYAVEMGGNWQRIR
jgi:hypothetical protein